MTLSEKSPLLFEGEYLRKLERLAILSRQMMAGQLQGERRSTKRGQSVEFSDFRPYSHGDDFRRIDWNAYARLERFFIKLFVEEEDLNVHMLVDTSESMNWGEPNKFNYAIRAAGSLGYIALVGLDRVIAAGFGERLHTFPAQRGKRQAQTLFSYLGQLTTGGQGNISSTMRAYAGNAHLPGPLLIFSDLMDPGWKDGLQTLAADRFEVSVLHIFSSDERSPGLTGDLRLLDSETGGDVEITADFDLINRYKQRFAAWQDDIRKFCGARRIQYIPVETSIPIQELLFAWLRQYGVLK